ncbi:Protein CL16A [Dissophora ornata]|nr:Protein CL16A [Dissophora ornata]
MFNLLWNKPKPERFSLENLKHFFEENVHWHFLEILQSKHDGSLIVQVLQTLNIMFENVRSQESLYFLLSNNYVNRVICLKYDFSNDEILAYYIYLLRTLSFKLSKDTIYFFFNEHLDDFPLYSEAIKFFNHEESMIRIAVRVITLNVYSVHDHQMQDFILDRTTTTYFSNLVWFIGNYGTTVNDMLLHSGESEFSRINYYLAEHMDCFYYVNDIIELEVPKINKILISHLLNRLLRPMYLDSLLPVSAQGSSTSKSSAPKLMPLVALSLMLHALHVLKHAPLVSALASTLFSNQHYSSHGQHQHQHQHHSHSHLRRSPSPLILGVQSVSPESSRPASPVTSKFHSFGLLGSSPASLDSYFPLLSAPVPQARLNPQHPFAPPLSHSPSPLPTGGLQQQQQQQQQHQQNPYKVSIYEYLSHVDSDRLVLPALTLIYLSGRNPGVMPDVLLGTDIYPQRLLKNRLLMGNLMSASEPPTKNLLLGAISMAREHSGDSILSNHSAGAGAGVTTLWSATPPGPGGPSTISGSLFGAGGSAAAARMRTKTESPLFETEEDNEETRETEELLASEVPEPTLPPTSPSLSSSSTVSTPQPRVLSSSLTALIASSSAMPRHNSADGDAFSKAKSRSNTRKGSKTASLLGPILPSATPETPERGEGEGDEMGQELRPVYTSERDRMASNIYPSSDEDEAVDQEQVFTIPPPLPPRPKDENQQQQKDKTGSMQESVGTQVGPTIQNREDLIDRFMDIICGLPESGAHRFRIITIQMATELLVEFVLTRGGGAANTGGATSTALKESQSNSAAQQAAEIRLGVTRLHRLALAEAQFRERVQKGIRGLECKKRRGFGPDASHSQPLGMLTGRVERALTESKIGIDKHVVNIIAESSVIYGPDKDLDKEPDLDPDSEMIALFGLDSDYTHMEHERPAADDSKNHHDRPLTSSTGSNVRDERRSRIRSTIKAKMQGVASSADSNKQQQHQTTECTSHPRQSRLTSLQRLEAMVIRYIKWLHLLIQSRQLLCRKAAVALVGSPLQPTLVTTTVSADPGTDSANADSPSISITETPSTLASTTESTPTPTPLGRRPSDLMGVGSVTPGAVASAHKGLQKALATTATTTTTALVGADSAPSKLVRPADEGGPLSVPSQSPTPSATTDSALISANPSASSSTSSLTSLNSFPAGASGAVSATLSQPASGTASGRVIGSRSLLTATAALEAAANSSSPATASTAGAHPFINDMLTNHLDPLSASVSEAIRKSGARIKKTVVDPLSTSSLFKASSLSSTSSHMAAGQEDATTTANRGFYRPSVPSSAASSVASATTKPSSSGMRRSLSTSSSSSSHSVAVVICTAPGAPEAGSVNVRSGRMSEDHTTLNEATPLNSGTNTHKTTDEDSFRSILDPGHPIHQTDDQVNKILQTLGLTSSSTFGE